ncbi:MAG: peptidyl-prolyl cis-trans isomerase [Verrucomicrobiaceae bacterium]|nr:peptidyl-prolyl cis-trans isomerase [Verrucomicrobiaceae bacterium]
MGSLFTLCFAGLTFYCPATEPKNDKGHQCAEPEPEPTSESASNPVIKIITSMGPIHVELNREKAPISVANFLAYVKDKHYDGTIFHRVIGDFMIQGGGFAKGDVPMQKKVKPPIKNEAKASGLSNLRGTIAMARTNAPDSATAQFFINVVDNKNLDAGGFSPDGYAVFGKVVSGMETVDKIRTVKTGSKALTTTSGIRPMRNVPLAAVIIESIALKK